MFNFVVTGTLCNSVTAGNGEMKWNTLSLVVKVPLLKGVHLLKRLQIILRQIHKCENAEMHSSGWQMNQFGLLVEL